MWIMWITLWKAINKGAFPVDNMFLFLGKLFSGLKREKEAVGPPFAEIKNSYFFRSSSPMVTTSPAPMVITRSSLAQCSRR